nr:immunoglobulin light chain junction region [Macaca mulatta]
CQQGDSYPLTF